MDDDDSTIDSQADLERCWRRLMEPLGFGSHSIWVMVVEPDGTPVRQVSQIQDTGRVPAAELVTGAAGLARSLADPVEGIVPHGRVAFLCSRPGREGVTATDRAVAAALYRGAQRAGVACEVVHLATDLDVLPLPMDEVLLSA